MVESKRIRTNNKDVLTVVKILREYGVCVIEPYLSKSEIGALKDEFYDFSEIPDTRYKTSTPYSKGHCYRVKKDLLDTARFPHTNQTFSDPFMKDIAMDYWDKSVQLNKEIFVVKDIVGSRHVANDLHFDVQPTLKFFIYLTDTFESNGAFYCVPGSHIETKKRRDAMGKKINFQNRSITRDHQFANSMIHPIEGSAGTLIIFSTEVFHKAGIVSQGERLVMRGHSRTKEQEKIGISKGASMLSFFGIRN